MISRSAMAGLILSASAAVVWAAKPAKSALVGTWELVEKSPITLKDSNPAGVANRKEHYTRDGKVYFIAPDQKMGSTPAGKYSFDGTRLRVITPNGKTSEMTVELLSPDRMKIVRGPSDEWTYARLSGPAAQDRELEPRSVERVRPETGKIQPVPAYDTADDSGLALEERVKGVWELAAVKDVPPDRVPPQGFTNDVWVHTGPKLCVIHPGGSLLVGACAAASLKDGSLQLAEGAAHSGTYAVSFDRWRRLVLARTNGTYIFKRISRNSSPVPRVPLTVVLLEPRP